MKATINVVVFMHMRLCYCLINACNVLLNCGLKTLMSMRLIFLFNLIYEFSNINNMEL